MEKKITKKFYSLSCLSLIPAALLGQGNVIDTLTLVGVLVALMLNHTLLVKMVSELSKTLASSDNDAKQALRKTVMFILAKFLVFGAVLGLVYFTNSPLLPKVVILMIFQLIIQVVSIKNNY